MSAAAVWFHGATGVYIEWIENGILDLNVKFKKYNKANCFCLRLLDNRRPNYPLNQRSSVEKIDSRVL